MYDRERPVYIYCRNRNEADQKNSDGNLFADCNEEAEVDDLKL